MIEWVEGQITMAHRRQNTPSGNPRWVVSIAPTEAPPMQLQVADDADANYHVANVLDSQQPLLIGIDHGRVVYLRDSEGDPLDGARVDEDLVEKDET